MDQRKRVAALVTEYRYHSHADLIVGKILEGYDQVGGAGPALRLVSMFVDQFPPGDMSRGLAKKYGFTIHDSVSGVLTNGGKDLAVDAVLLIGEHGTYPKNARGQTLYPRRKWFKEATDLMERLGKVVPIFNDKHLGVTWEDGRWMLDRARQLKIPLLAGSSIPYMWRRPDLNLPRGCELLEAQQMAYGPVEGYGFHALEGLQAMVERRKGGETGVAAVQAIPGQAMWKAYDEGKWPKELFAAMVKLVERHHPDEPRKATALSPDALVWLIEYRDGLRASVPMPNGWIYEGDGGCFYFAAKIRRQPKPVATQFYQQLADPFGHFDFQVKAIESMVLTGHPPVPAERTLLTTGMLDALMISSAEKGRRIETPHLAIKYQPSDWPHATGPVPKEVKRKGI